MAFPLETPAAATDLISFLKALPDCRMRRGIRFPQWWMLLGTDFGNSPSDATFRLLRRRPVDASLPRSGMQ